MRPASHRIETLALRNVASALPSEWVERDLTGRDYGIDRSVELFEAARASGTFLLLQIKGRDLRWPPTEVFRQRFPVRTLLYAEQMEVPVIGVACPVREPQPTFGFVWLQEYIRVVLDSDQSLWRTLKSATVHIPPENRIPGAEARLRWIAAHPQRLGAIGQLTRIQHEMAFESQTLSQGVGADIARLEHLFREAEQTAMTFGANSMEVAIARDGLNALALVRRGGPYAPKDFKGLGIQLTFAGHRSPPDVLDFVVRSHVETSAARLGAILAQRNDVGLRRSFWMLEQAHNF